MNHHRGFCKGDCDEGRECWRMNLVSQEEADRRNIKLMSEEDVNRLIMGDDVTERR